MTRANSKWVGVSVIVRRGGLWLMHQRHDGAGCDSGLWGVPGGIVERGETFIAAAIRETREETGRYLGWPEFVTMYDLDKWVVMIVEGYLVGDPMQPTGELHKAGPWQWLSSDEIERLRDGGQLQGGLERYFRADGMP